MANNLDAILIDENLENACFNFAGNCDYEFDEVRDITYELPNEDDINKLVNYYFENGEW